MHASVLDGFGIPGDRVLGWVSTAMATATDLGFGSWDPRVWKLYSGRPYKSKTAHGWTIHMSEGIEDLRTWCCLFQGCSVLVYSGYQVHGLKNLAVAGLVRYPYFQDKPNLREYCVPGYVTSKIETESF